MLQLEIDKRLRRLEQIKSPFAEGISWLRQNRRGDVNSAMNKIRYLTEMLMHHLCQADGVKAKIDRQDRTLGDLIPIARTRGLLNEVHLRLVHIIQTHANRGSHYTAEGVLHLDRRPLRTPHYR